MDREKESLLDCIIRKPVLLKVGELTSGTAFKSGCAVVDVLFPGHDTVKIDCITFQNNYTASIEIKAKVREEGKHDTWKVCVKRHTLMPQPHYEAGSQDYVTITKDIMSCETDEVILLRLILRQPSPHWVNFSIENVKCYMPSNLGLVSSPSWLNVDDEDSSSATKIKNQGLPESEDVAELMQQMWAMTQELKAVTNHDRPIGRFDVDGSYDINLLSYT